MEFATPNVDFMHNIFIGFGFSKLKKFKSKNIAYYKQNNINFLLNQEAHGFSMEFSNFHGPSICSIGWRVRDAEFAFNEAIRRGATSAENSNNDLPYPAIYGIGDSLIYFIDKYGPKGTIYDSDFVEIHGRQNVKDKGFIAIDHYTNNVYKATMDTWVKFYKDVCGFTEIRYFNIRGEKTGLTSCALRSPDGSFCIPINEGDESESQIEEYLREYKGSGIQHLALLTNDILFSLDALERSNIETLDIHEKYYKTIFDLFPDISLEHRAQIEHHQVLVDGDQEGILLQVFTRNLFGPIFFEIIQRNGCRGFGEGNFQALFESIERDQARRRVI